MLGIDERVDTASKEVGCNLESPLRYVSTAG